MATILVVDDAQTDRDLIGKILGSYGHHMAFASDGIDALPRARDVKPDLVIMDIVMPQMDGYKAMRELRSEPATSLIPVVVVSSKSASSDVFWGKKQGAADYVTKPFTAEHLVEVVHRILKIAVPSMRQAAAAAPSRAPDQPRPPDQSQAVATPQAIGAIQAAYMRVIGPFGKITFQDEFDRLSTPAPSITKSHLRTLVTALLETLEPESRPEFEKAVKQYIS